MGLQHGVNGWAFKDENQGEEQAPAGSSSASFKPKSEFEKYMIRQVPSLSTLCITRLENIDKIIAIIQEKLGIQSLDDGDDDDEN